MGEVIRSFQDLKAYQRAFELQQDIAKALERAQYEIIDDEEPFYGEVPGLEGIWATGCTLEACRRALDEAVEDWVFFSIAKGLPIPELDGLTLRVPEIVPS